MLYLHLSEFHFKDTELVKFHEKRYLKIILSLSNAMIYLFPPKLLQILFFFSLPDICCLFTTYISLPFFSPASLYNFFVKGHNIYNFFTYINVGLSSVTLSRTCSGQSSLNTPHRPSYCSDSLVNNYPDKHCQITHNHMQD